MRVLWDDEAYKDLSRIYTFLANVSEAAAYRLYLQIYDEAESLGALPFIGSILQMEEEFLYPSRSYLCKNKQYKILYYINTDKNHVYIYQIWDCRQDPARFNNRKQSDAHYLMDN